MKRIAAVIAIVTLGLGMGMVSRHDAGATSAGTRPNILFILTDDQRWDTLAHLTRPDGKIVRPMPTVEDQLMAKGMTFTNYFDSIGLCCPSRTSIMRGQYAQHTGVYSNLGAYGGWDAFQSNGDDLSNVVTTLHDAGYLTGLVGKYLNGYGPDDAATVPPGWDTWNALTNVDYFNFSESVNGTLTHFPDASYQTNVLGRQALDFLATAAQGDEPFFLYWAPHAPHAPATPAPVDKNSFAWMQGSPWRPASYDEADVSDKPPSVQAPAMAQELKDGTDDFRERQYESLQAVDRWIGQIIGALTPDQLANTLVIFTSDNGMMWGEHRLAKMKNVLYDEAIRGPFVARWDGVIPAGTTDDHLIGNIDLAATFADVAGATIPYQVDGVSLMPLLTGSPPADWRHAYLLEHGGGGPDNFAPAFAGVRTDTAFDPQIHHAFAYAWYFGEEGFDEELYDVTVDPLEMNDILRPGGLPSSALVALIAQIRQWVAVNAVPLPPLGSRAPGRPRFVIDEDP